MRNDVQSENEELTSNNKSDMKVDKNACPKCNKMFTSPQGVWQHINRTNVHKKSESVDKIYDNNKNKK